VALCNGVCIGRGLLVVGRDLVWWMAFNGATGVEEDVSVCSTEDEKVFGCVCLPLNLLWIRERLGVLNASLPLGLSLMPFKELRDFHMDLWICRTSMVWGDCLRSLNYPYSLIGR